MRVGIICEGSTDYAVLETLVKALVRDSGLVISPLQPNFDALRLGQMSQGTGWQAVRKYLRSAAFPVTVTSYDLIIVQVDADIRHEREIRSQLSDEPQEDELSALCAHVKSWMAGGVPDSAVVTLPREATEAWLLSAHTRKKNVELIDRPALVLAESGLILKSGRGLHKSKEVYGALAGALVRMLGDMKTMRQIPELERFVGKVRQVLQLRRKKPR